MNDVSDFLGNSAARDLGMQYASSRLVAKQARDNAFYDGVVSGIYNVHQATAQRNASFNGFRADLMTQEDWGKTISAQTQKWAQQDAASLFEMGSYLVGGGALVAGGVKLMTAGALQIAKSGFRGAFIHGSSNTAAAMGVVQGGARLTAGYHAADIGFNIATNPGGTAELVRSGISTGQTIYRESVRNGGFTYATGVTGELDVGTKMNLALGGYLSVDFNKMDFNYGFYGTGEFGSKLGLPNPTVAVGWEHTVFTSSDYLYALTGKYRLHGGGDNYRNTGRALTSAYISAANGEISGYQFTSEIKSLSHSIKTGFTRDPQIYTNFGYGAIYDAKAGGFRGLEWLWEK